MSDAYHFVANAGTPLMWAGCFQLIFGNYLLGVCEAWLISRWTRKPCSSLPMVIANYASMIVGIFIATASGPLQPEVARDPFRLALPTIGLFMAVAFVATIFVEWPFVAHTVSESVNAKTLAMSAGIQTASYLVLVLLTVTIGSISAVTALRPVEIEEISTVEGWLYYGSFDGKTVFRTRLDGSVSERILHFEEARDDNSRVTVEPDALGEGAELWWKSRRDLKSERLQKVGSSNQVAAGERLQDGRLNLGNLTFGPYSTRSFVESPTVHAGFWAREGLRIDGKTYALETPICALAWRSAVVLPDGKAVAQFGNAIFLIDPQTRQVAKIVEGVGGDVLLDKAILNTSEAAPK